MDDFGYLPVLDILPASSLHISLINFLLLLFRILARIQQDFSHIFLITSPIFSCMGCPPVFVITAEILRFLGFLVHLVFLFPASSVVRLSFVCSFWPVNNFWKQFIHYSIICFAQRSPLLCFDVIIIDLFYTIQQIVYLIIELEN